MSLSDRMLPLLKLGAMAAGAALLWHRLAARGRRGPAAVTITYTYDSRGNMVGNTAPPPAAGPRSGGGGVRPC